MVRQPRVLIVDDEPDIRNLIGQILGDFGYVVTEVHDAAAARNAVRIQQFDAVLLDIWMPGDDGITLLREWRKSNFNIPVIMLSAHGSIETAVEATRYGAYDYLEKPVSAARLEVTLRNAVSNRAPAEGAYDMKSKPGIRRQFIGSSAKMDKIRTEIKNAASSKSNVLILGEVGTGRTVAAHNVHTRRGCTPDSLIVLDWLSEDGIRSSATKTIQAVAKGSLLIRDLHAYDTGKQNRLLVLLDHIDNQRSESADTPNLISTASPHLLTKLQNGSFRPELYHRLGELKIMVPPLREHPEDVPELVGFLIEEFCQAEGLTYKRIATAALNRLRNYHWTGNVIELKNVVLQAMHNTTEETITDSEINSLLAKLVDSSKDPSVEQPGVSPLFDLPFREAKDVFDREYLTYHLQNCKTYQELAKITGLHRASIFRKIKDLGIELQPGGELLEHKNMDNDS